MEREYQKIYKFGTDAALKITPGHFATNHAHTNYYLDVITLKARTNEAQQVAKAMASMYLYDTVVDTIVCMEGTEVIGAYLSEELTKSGFMNTNLHKTIYVVRPEFNGNSQIIFRDNLQNAIRGKHVIVLMATVTTGYSAKQALEGIAYYGGKVQGLSAIFSAIDSVDEVPIHAVFGMEDLPDYESYDCRNCPQCNAGRKIDALVNAFGHSTL